MTDFKQKLRGFFSDSSLFRRIYIIDLFFTNIAFLQIPAYVLLVFLFIWGVCLSVYNQRHNNTFFKLRFGIWIGAFLAVTVFSMLINFSQTFLFSLLMLLHVVMCFFLFYGMHTEPEFDYRIELYHIAKFIMYATTVINIIGITCLMFGFKFEWYWIKFTNQLQKKNPKRKHQHPTKTQPETPRLHSCGVDFLLPYTFKRAFYAQNCRKNS